MILTGRFSEFVYELIAIRNDEKDEQTLWDLYLHSRSFLEKSFKEFSDSLKAPKQTDIVPTEEELIATVTGSMGILADFKLS